MTTKRVAGYVRLSKETEDTTSPERQRQAIRRLCRDRGWTLSELFEDIDVSAFNGRHRPGLDRLMSRLADFDAIVFWKLDRLSRSSVEAGQIADRCKAEGVDLVATDMNLDTTSAGGKFIYTVLAASGEMESARISERSRSMMEFKRSRDEWVGRAPYGWKVRDKHLVPDRSQQAALRSAARTFVRGGTYAEAARVLGVSAPSVAQRIFVTPRVQAALGDLGDELAEALRARRLDRVPRSARSLLGGVARCGDCSAPMRLSSTRAGRSGRWKQYRCGEPGHAGISGRWLEEHVSQTVVDAIDPKSLARRMRERQRNPRAAEVAAAEARITELEDMLGDGTLTKPAFVRQRDRLMRRIADLREIDRDEDAPDLPLEIARNLATYWRKMTTAERRDVIRAVVRQVVVSKAPPRSNGRVPSEDRVSIEWRA
jgi:DNA invertase Pin-like site-specific DNA recombinase